MLLERNILWAGGHVELQLGLDNCILFQVKSLMFNELLVFKTVGYILLRRTDVIARHVQHLSSIRWLGKKPEPAQGLRTMAGGVEHVED